jgi:hypothetical protein
MSRAADILREHPPVQMNDDQTYCETCDIVWTSEGHLAALFEDERSESALADILSEQMERHGHRHWCVEGYNWGPRSAPCPDYIAARDALALLDAPPDREALVETIFNATAEINGHHYPIISTRKNAAIIADALLAGPVHKAEPDDDLEKLRKERGQVVTMRNAALNKFEGLQRRIEKLCDQADEARRRQGDGGYVDPEDLRAALAATDEPSCPWCSDLQTGTCATCGRAADEGGQ